MTSLAKYRYCGQIKTTITGELLYLALNDLADRYGELTIPQRRISDALNISRSTVSRNLRRLERAGAITIIPTYHSDGGRAANQGHKLHL